MTTCAQCLSELSTMRMADMRPGTPVALHCESCPDCTGIMQEIAYAERRLSTALSEARSGFTPEELSETALTGSERERRKYVGRWTRGLLAAAGCVTFFFFMQNVFIPRVDPPQPISRETISLNCITPQQAMEIATPYLRSHGSSIYTAGGLKAITISGQPAEFIQAVNHVKLVDDEQKCQLPSPAIAGTPGSDVVPVHVDNPDEKPATAPPPTATSSGIPKKD